MAFSAAPAASAEGISGMLRPTTPESPAVRPPTLTDVNAWRAASVWVLRSVSVVLLAAGAYLALKKVLFGIGTGQLDMIYGVWEGIGEGQSFYRGLALLAVGAGLGAGAHPIARWAFPVPRGGCPRCGYASGRPTCPECGLGNQPVSQESAPPPAT
jgi:hypothetical protein